MFKIPSKNQPIKTELQVKRLKTNQGFQWDGTVQLFVTKGQKLLCCPGTKGQAKNLAKRRAGTKQDRAETKTGK